MTPIPIKAAVTEAGGVTTLARRLGVTRMTIYRWLKRGQMPDSFQALYWVSRPRGRKRA